jgi:hypothetical protein
MAMASMLFRASEVDVFACVDAHNVNGLTDI